MNPFGIIKGFNVLEYQTICLLIITYFKSIDPFPFNKRMKRFDTCIIPWKGLFRVAALHFCSSFPICLGYNWLPRSLLYQIRYNSDRGYQYISKAFKKKLDDVGMTQSMSRVSRCIDNGPMEAFWGMLKTEKYYLKAFPSYEELKQAVIDYIGHYNGSRYQKLLYCMTPLEYRYYLQTKAA